MTDEILPDQFFREMLPAGFAAQREVGASVPQDFTMQYVLTGDGGGEWAVTIENGAMQVASGRHEAALTITLSVQDWRDAMLARNGAAPSVIVPPSRPGRPDNTPRVKQLKGTIVQELLRDAGDAFTIELCFNGAAAPRAVLKVKLADFVAMQEGRLNGQEAFMTGRLRIEGDMAFMMQVAALTV